MYTRALMKGSTTSSLTAAALFLVVAGCGPDAPQSRSAPAPQQPLESTATDGPQRAMLLFQGFELEQVRAALDEVDGRLLAHFDEPVAILRIDRRNAATLEQRLPGARVVFGPVLDEASLRLAPGPLGFWNRRHGVTASSQPLAQPAEPPPRRAPASRPITDDEPLSPALEAAAQAVLRGFLTCLADESARQQGCLDRFLAADDQRSASAQLEREAALAATEEVDIEDYRFRRLGYDGHRATYEVIRGGHPTGALNLTLDQQEATWTVTAIDP